MGMRKTMVLLAAIVPLLGANGKAGGATPEYGDVRIREFKVAMQCWTFRKFTFLETLKKVGDLGIKYLEAYPGQKLGGSDPEATFDVGMSQANVEMVKAALQKHNIRLVNFGVVGFKNTPEAVKEIFEFAKKMGIETIVTEPQSDDLSLIDKAVKEYRIRVAIHNHPEPSKYAHPETVLKVIAGTDELIGDCGDTGHWLRTGIVPVDALRLLKGRILDMHLKDLDAFGKKDAVDVPFGSGKADIRDILAELTLQNYRGYLVIEHERESEADNPSPAIKKGLEYLDKIMYFKGYDEILGYYGDGYEKHGWNHYGPGYFELDNKTGVLTSNGGMGLLWYSVKKYGDFILELDFKCLSPGTNSGVFIRVPEVPTSDDYIHHSFEIQIDDAETAPIHVTGSVYDAEGPKENAFKPTGEWNHYKISFIGDVITVELNGKRVVHWKAEPRGKIRDFAREGYIGLQNHPGDAGVSIRNVFAKELTK
jgi:sugar phosphate isomerase/epimerase